MLPAASCVACVTATVVPYTLLKCHYSAAVPRSYAAATHARRARRFIFGWCRSLCAVTRRSSVDELSSEEFDKILSAYQEKDVQTAQAPPSTSSLPSFCAVAASSADVAKWRRRCVTGVACVVPPACRTCRVALVCTRLYCACALVGG
jgi:hypothetical protein